MRSEVASDSDQAIEKGGGLGHLNFAAADRQWGVQFRPEAARFLRLLDARAMVFNFSWYPEKGTKTPLQGRLGELDATYRNARFDNDFAELLALLNGYQRAIYVCMNVLGAKNGSDTRTDDNVAKARAIFADFDEGLPAKPFPIKPTCLVHTSNDIGTGGARYQAFWRVKDLSLQEFDAIEARLVEDWGADPNSVNASRIQRLPGYWHQKHGVPHLVSIVEENDVTCTRDQIVKAFPPLLHLPAVKQKGSVAAVHASKRRPRNSCRDMTRGSSTASDDIVDVAALSAALAHLARTPHPNSKHSETYADDYDAWVLFGLAIKRALGDDGFEIWDEWARTSSRYPGAPESQAKWDGFDIDARSGNKAITVGSIFFAAKRHGWSGVGYRINDKLARVLRAATPWGQS